MYVEVLVVRTQSCIYITTVQKEKKEKQQDLGHNGKVNILRGKNDEVIFPWIMCNDSFCNKTVQN